MDTEDLPVHEKHLRAMWFSLPCVAVAESGGRVWRIPAKRGERRAHFTQFLLPAASCFQSLLDDEKHYLAFDILLLNYTLVWESCLHLLTYPFAYFYVGYKECMRSL